MKSTLNKSTHLSYKKFLKQPFAIKKESSKPAKLSNWYTCGWDSREN